MDVIRTAAGIPSNTALSKSSDMQLRNKSANVSTTFILPSQRPFVPSTLAVSHEVHSDDYDGTVINNVPTHQKSNNRRYGRRTFRGMVP